MDIQLQPALLRQISPDLNASLSKTAQSFQEALTQASSSDQSKSPDQSKSSDQSKIANAAQQFEALMLGQLLKTARESSDGGWLGTGEDQAGELAVDMAQQQFAQAMSARGGLGIAKMVTAGLERGAAKAAKSGSPTSNQATPPNMDSPR
jgi:flagellar protein FlgJ